MHFECETEIIRSSTSRMDRLAAQADMERHNALAAAAAFFRSRLRMRRVSCRLSWVNAGLWSS